MKTLKKLFAIAFISIGALACSSDDDANSDSTSENKANIIGTWKFTSSTTNGVSDTDLYICDFEETYEIDATSITIKFYWDPSGDDGSNCELDGTFAFNYDIDGNIISDEEGNSIKILTLNSTTFKYEETYTEDGVTDTYTETYTRQ